MEHGSMVPYVPCIDRSREDGLAVSLSSFWIYYLVVKLVFQRIYSLEQDTGMHRDNFGSIRFPLERMCTLPTM